MSKYHVAKSVDFDNGWDVWDSRGGFTINPIPFRNRNDAVAFLNQKQNSKPRRNNSHKRVDWELTEA